jgi:hypothetical protein
MNIERSTIESWAQTADERCIRELSRMLAKGYRHARVVEIIGRAVRVNISGDRVEFLRMGHETPPDVKVDDRGFAFYGEIPGGMGWHFVR